MNKLFFTLLLLVLTAYAQQERVAIIQTLDNNDSIGFNDLALNIDENISFSIDPLIVPRDGTPAVGLAFNVRY